MLDSKEPLIEALLLLSIDPDPRPGAGMEMSSFPADILGTFPRWLSAYFLVYVWLGSFFNNVFLIRHILEQTEASCRSFILKMLTGSRIACNLHGQWFLEFPLISQYSFTFFVLEDFDWIGCGSPGPGSEAGEGRMLSAGGGNAAALSGFQMETTGGFCVSATRTQIICGLFAV